MTEPPRTPDDLRMMAEVRSDPVDEWAGMDAEWRRLKRIEAAARRYQSAEWAIRLNEDEPRMTPEHNARVEEWRAADRELRVLFMEDAAP